MEGIFVAFIAHPHDHTFLNLRIQALQYTVCIIGHSLYSTIYIAGHSLYSTTFYKRHSLYSIPPHKSAHICIRASRMGPLPAWAPLVVFTFSKWHLTCHSSTSLSKEPQTPHRHGPTPVSHSRKSQAAKLKLLTQVDQLHLRSRYINTYRYGQCVVNSVTVGAPWGCPPKL